MTEVHPQVARALALHPLIQRDGDEINRRREAGESFRAIGRAVGLSGQRIHQLMKT